MSTIPPVSNTPTTPILRPVAASESPAAPQDRVVIGAAPTVAAAAPPSKTEGVAERARRVWLEEAASQVEALPQWSEKYDELSRAGCGYALATLAAHPALGEEISATFAARHLFKGFHCLIPGEDLKYLEMAPTSPAQQHAICGPMERIADYILEMARTHQVDPLLFADALATMGSLVTSQPGIGRVMEPALQSKLAALFQSAIAGMEFGERLRGTDWECAGNVLKASVQLHQETDGRFPVDWMLQRLGQQDAGAPLYVRTALALGRPIPPPIADRLQAATQQWTSHEDAHNFFYNQDWFKDRLLLLHQMFDASHDDAGRSRLAQDLSAATNVPEIRQHVQQYLGTSQPEVRPDPMFRLKVGDEQFEFGTPVPAAPKPYKGRGPADRKAAVQRLLSAQYLSERDFWEQAGDQALLALGDPQAGPAVRGKLTDIVARDQFMARDLLDRLPKLQEIFPQEAVAAQTGIAQVLHDAIERGGDAAESITYYLDSPALTHDQRLDLLASEIELHRRPTSDADTSETSRIQRRGILLRALADELGAPPLQELPQAGVQKLRDDLAKRRDEMLGASFEDRSKDLKD